MLEASAAMCPGYVRVNEATQETPCCPVPQVSRLTAFSFYLLESAFASLLYYVQVLLVSAICF